RCSKYYRHNTYVEALAEGCHEVRGVSERGVPQETNDRHRRLLRARRERPSGRAAAEQSDELASSSIEQGLLPVRLTILKSFKFQAQNQGFTRLFPLPSQPNPRSSLTAGPSSP